jgi:hypothetical protein
LLSPALLSFEWTLPSSAIPDSARIVIWCAGAAALMAPFPISRRLHSTAEPIRLLIALVSTGVASSIGVALMIITGDLMPIRIFAPASMLAVLGWSWTYRACFRSELLTLVVSRYTKTLVFIGIVSLLWATIDVAVWVRAQDSELAYSPTALVIFCFALLGVAALAVTRLRKTAPHYARSATQVLSGALLFFIPFGSLAALYWILRVRRREQGPGPNTQAA